MERLNEVKMASFSYGLIRFYKYIMETLYNVLISLLFCLLKIFRNLFIYAYEANI